MVTVNDFQKNLNRRPIVEIISGSFQNDIPFDGEIITDETDDESLPFTIMHSSGRLLLVYLLETSSGNDEIHYKYTDTSREQFSSVSWQTFNTNAVVEDLSMTELKNGNVGIMWLEFKSGTYYLRIRIVQEDGIFVSESEMFNVVAAQGDYIGANTLRLQ